MNAPCVTVLTDRHYIEEEVVSALGQEFRWWRPLASRSGEALYELLPVPEAPRSQTDAYLAALIIFAALVIALPEFIAKYRLHGANLFLINEDKTAGDRIKHCLAMRAVLPSEIRVWLETMDGGAGIGWLRAR